MLSSSFLYAFTFIFLPKNALEISKVLFANIFIIVGKQIKMLGLCCISEAEIELNQAELI